MAAPEKQEYDITFRSTIWQRCPMAPNTVVARGTPDYEKSVNSVLTTIEQNDVGKVILEELSKQHTSFAAYRATKGDPILIRIVPYNAGKAAVLGEKNAAVQADHPRRSAPKGASGRGPAYWYTGREDDPRTPLKDERDTLVSHKAPAATGEGSGSTVFFSPEIHTQSSFAHHRPDVVLLHELVHALRNLQGLTNPIPTKEHIWQNEEEYLAVVVENVYLSAAGATKLRRGHGRTYLTPPLDTSAGFLDYESEFDGKRTRPNRELMSIHQLLWPTFQQLALKVRSAPFNPFRELANRNAHLFSR